MKVARKGLGSGAQEAEGLAVIIDVFRAFTCEPLFFHFGATKVILEAVPEKAIARKRNHPDFLLAGEVNEVPIEGGDLGNSPSEIVRKGRPFFRDRTVIHRTTAGVTGAVAALVRADEVLLGSFLTARATAAYIQRKRPEIVTLVAMGERAERTSPEDEGCADYIEHLLTGRPFDAVDTLKGIVFHPCAQKFIQGKNPHLPQEDPIFCLQRDIFDFVLRAEKADEGIMVTRIDLCPNAPQPSMP